MLVNKKTFKCKVFAFALVREHVQKDILILNGITSKNYSYGRWDVYKKMKYAKFSKNY